MSILDILRKIKLWKTLHADTAGQRKIRNLINYLNGDANVADEDPDLCDMVRPFIVWLNDDLPYKERYRLTPYLERAIGSATKDEDVIWTRLNRVVDFAQYVAQVAKRHVESLGGNVDGVVLAAIATEASAKFAAVSAARYAPPAAAIAAVAAARHAMDVKYARHAILGFVGCAKRGVSTPIEYEYDAEIHGACLECLDAMLHPFCGREHYI